MAADTNPPRGHRGAPGRGFWKPRFPFWRALAIFTARIRSKRLRLATANYRENFKWLPLPLGTHVCTKSLATQSRNGCGMIREFGETPTSSAGD